MMKKKVICTAIAAALFAVWMWFPRPMAGLVDSSSTLKMVLFAPGHSEAELVIQPETPEMKAVQTVLGRHSYHMCHKSIALLDFFRDYRLNVGGTTVRIRDADGKGFGFSCAGNQFYRYPSVQIACLDYGGEDPGTALCEELLTALGIA